jgi:hypothetical protein
MPANPMTPAELEQSIRGWVHRLEQAWNDGSIDRCIQQFQPEVIISRGNRKGSISRTTLQRALHMWCTPIPGVQATSVIKSVQTLEEAIEIVAKIHFRCLRGEQLEDAHVKAQIHIISGGANGWTAASIHLLPSERQETST